MRTRRAARAGMKPRRWGAGSLSAVSRAGKTAENRRKAANDSRNESDTVWLTQPEL